jgi:xanthine dehydrogenase accessory factor
LIWPDGQQVGNLPVELDLEAIQAARLPVQLNINAGRVFVEPVHIAGTAYIFGAGHVSRSLAAFTQAVGFWTVVLDDRADYANQARFPAADQIVVLDSFDDWAGKIAIDRDSYVIIVTRGHQNDRIVLAQALKTEAAYIGMIGSRRKCDLVFGELRRAGFSEEDIQRVHAPIGIPIAAETPEEIGVSIVAEMIQARAALQKEILK